MVRIQNPILRYDPSIVSICMKDFHFKPIKILYNKSPEVPFNKMFYTYLYYQPKDLLHELDPNFFDTPKRLNQYYTNVRWYSHFLDVSNLNYPFKWTKIPSFFEGVEYVDHTQLKLVHQELEKMKMDFEIKTIVDGYQIDKNIFIMFDNKYNFIKE